MAIGIGGASAAKLFAERTGFPEELLYYDETAECASALGSVPRTPAFCVLSGDGLARRAPPPAAAADARRVAALQLLAGLWARDGISAAEQRAEPVPAAPPHAPRRRVAWHARQGSVTTSPSANEARCRRARVKPAGAGARRAASARPHTDAHPGAGDLWVLWGPQRRPALDPSPGPRASRRPVLLEPKRNQTNTTDIQLSDLHARCAQLKATATGAFPFVEPEMFDRLGAGYLRPFELATVRLQNMIGILNDWCCRPCAGPPAPLPPPSVCPIDDTGCSLRSPCAEACCAARQGQPHSREPGPGRAAGRHACTRQRRGASPAASWDS
jgi:hypothetical protein